jgi:flagellar basal body-associated protein FliL
MISLVVLLWVGIVVLFWVGIVAGVWALVSTNSEYGSEVSQAPANE